jgi:hydrogenase maturation factor
MKKKFKSELLFFIKYLIIWISQNLSIPFWVIGHVHLTVNVYDDLTELLASIGMNIIVAVGFVLSYLDEKNVKRTGSN